MQQVIKYKCKYCSSLFNSKETCLEHEAQHQRILQANSMLKTGHSLEKLENDCKIWYERWR